MIELETLVKDSRSLLNDLLSGDRKADASNITELESHLEKIGSVLAAAIPPLGDRPTDEPDHNTWIELLCRHSANGSAEAARILKIENDILKAKATLRESWKPGDRVTQTGPVRSLV